MEKAPFYFDKSLIFRHIPLFSNLNFFEKKLIQGSLEVVEVKKSQIIYRQGDAPSDFFCIVTGRVEIFSEQNGKEQVLEHIHRGKYFGFISLLTGEPHSVSARAVNDTVLVRISKSDFSIILKNIPRLAIDLSRMLSRRLKSKDIHPKSIFESTIIASYAEENILAENIIYAFHLAKGLKSQTGKKVIYVDLQTDVSDQLFAEFGLKINMGFFSQEPFFDPAVVFSEIQQTSWGVDVLRVLASGERVGAPFLIALLTSLVNDYHYVVIALSPSLIVEPMRILAQADQVHLLAGPAAVLLRTLSLNLQETGVWQDVELKKKMRLVILEEPEHHGKGRSLSCQEESALFHQPIYATLPALSSNSLIMKDTSENSAYLKTLRRISRHIGENLMGLALGSGSAMGMAHIGVLRVLEEEEVPIDIVCGSSIGALIGALWCSGYSADQVQEIIESNMRKNYLFGWDDLAMPLRGLIKGGHVRSFLKKYLKSKTFCDLKRPFKVVACDCQSMKQVVFDSGRLVDAVMASISIPGIFVPFRIGRRHYVDGGILNPLPTDVLLDAGARKVISVNVLPAPDEIERNLELKEAADSLSDALNPFLRVRRYLLRHWKRFFQPNIFDVIVSCVQSAEYLLAEFNALSQSDVALHPDMTAVSWSAFDQAPELIKRGEEEARLHLKQIKELAQASN